MRHLPTTGFRTRRRRAPRGALRLAASVLALATLPLACGGGAPEPPGTAVRPEETELAELEALYRMRTDSARSRFTPADVRFMTGMIAHHAQALVMANLAPTHDASPPIRRLTARILNAQQDEIATMQRWLRDRGQPVPEVRVEGTTFEIRGVDPPMTRMPGMLTPEQMRELDAARGREFDRLFLTDMIQHHRGAVTMVHDLFATDGAAQDEQAFKLASDIQVDQATEIARMERMLAELSAEPHRR